MRLIIFLIFTIVLIGTTDVSWQLVQLSRTDQSLHDAKSVIQKNAGFLNNKKSQTQSHHISRAETIDMFLTWVGMSDLMLSTLSVTENGEEDSDLDINAELSGQFKDMVQFLNEISRQCFPFLIRNAIISKKDAGVKLKLEAMLVTICGHSSNKPVLTINDIDPFLKMDSENGRNDFSARQIQLVGFFRYPDHLSAVIRMPDGRAKEIVTGDLVGNEKAIVMHVDEKNIAIQLNGKIQNITRE